MNTILYAMPICHTVSFTLVALKHVDYIEKLNLAKVYVMDELVFSGFYSSVRYEAVLHPHIYI